MLNAKIVLVAVALILGAQTAGAQWFGGGGFGSSIGSGQSSVAGAVAPGTHKELFFAPGIFLTGEAGYRISSFGFGLIGLVQWDASRYNYTPVGTSIFFSTSYALTQRRLAWGPSVKFFIPGTSFRIFGEYYPNVGETIIWGEPKAENPFREGDTLSGWGWGLGFGYSFLSDHVLLHATYRQFIYKKASLSGVSGDIPGGRLDKAEYSGVFAGASYLF